MRRPLNIPLSNTRTTRRDHTRVVSVYTAIALGALLAILFVRIPFMRSATLRVMPTNTVVSIHVLITPHNIDTLQSNIGELPVMPGSPWTMNDIIARSHREFSVHIAADGTQSYTLDTPLTTSEMTALQSFGYAATTAHSATLVAPIGTTSVQDGPRLTLRALSPFFDGDVLIHHEEGSDRTTLSVTREGITLHGLGTKANNENSPYISSESTVLAQFTILPNSQMLPESIAALLPIPATSRALAMLRENGGTIVLTQDSEGIGYFVSFHPGELSVEDLAGLGKDIINRQTLTTRALTTDDGEQFAELRADPDAITTEVRAEEDFTFISLTNNEGFALRLARTPTILTLANREIPLENSNQPRSQCLYRAHTWLNPVLITDMPTSAQNSNRTLQVLLSQFSEIAINSRNISLCW